MDHADFSYSLVLHERGLLFSVLFSFRFEWWMDGCGLGVYLYLKIYRTSLINWLGEMYLKLSIVISWCCRCLFWFCNIRFYTFRCVMIQYIGPRCHADRRGKYTRLQQFLKIGEPVVNSSNSIISIRIIKAAWEHFPGALHPQFCWATTTAVIQLTMWTH